MSSVPSSTARKVIKLSATGAKMTPPSASAPVPPAPSAAAAAAIPVAPAPLEPILSQRRDRASVVPGATLPSDASDSKELALFSQEVALVREHIALGCVKCYRHGCQAQVDLDAMYAAHRRAALDLWKTGNKRLVGMHWETFSRVAPECSVCNPDVKDWTSPLCDVTCLRCLPVYCRRCTDCKGGQFSDDGSWVRPSKRELAVQLPPVRCLTCGKLVPFRSYVALRDRDISILDSWKRLRIERSCCRAMLMGCMGMEDDTVQMPKEEVVDETV